MLNDLDLAFGWKGGFLDKARHIKARNDLAFTAWMELE
jgi:hypothetical protein